MESSFWFGTIILGRSIVYIEGAHVIIQNDFEVFTLKKSNMEYIFLLLLLEVNNYEMINERWHELSNNVVCATSNGSDQPAHTHSLIRAFASRLNIP